MTTIREEKDTYSKYCKECKKWFNLSKFFTSESKICKDCQLTRIKNQISLKVWRHTDEKWSRQSEELPIHRNLDLSILFLASISVDESAHYPKSNLREEIDIPTDVQNIKDYYEDNKKFIEPRLKELKRLLEEII